MKSRPWRLAAVASLVLSAAPARAQGPGTSQVPTSGGPAINVIVTSVMVGDQEKALRFYTDVLGFVKKVDVPAGGARWLTVVSPEQPGGPEVLLEPLGFAPAKVFQRALYDAGIPLTMFGVADIEAAYQRLKAKGVLFKTPPTKTGSVTIAVFDDTCGNLIQLAQR